VNDKGCAEVDWYVTYDGHIRGRVTDVDGIPVGHLVVELERRDGNSFNGFAIVDLKETGNDGRYEFQNVGPGEYFVVANNLGASPVRPYPKVFYPAAETGEEATPVQVGASASVEAINVVMPRAWKKVTVTAKVVEADGTAAAGVTVYGREVKDQSSVEPMTAITGADGKVILPVYEGQEYYATATENGGVQQRCGGPVKFVAKEGLDLGTFRIENPWGNCLAQLNPKFRRPR
jgi:5-hydroxyisourate hydrolase-like protein (transthyretin family)